MFMFLSWIRQENFFNRESSFMDRTLLFYPKAPISDGTHSLQGIHWWATDVLLKFCKSVLIKKMNSYIYLGWPEVEYIFSKYNFLGELFLYCCFDSASTRWHRWAISKYCSSSYKLVLSVLGGIKKVAAWMINSLSVAVTALIFPVLSGC